MQIRPAQFAERKAVAELPPDVVQVQPDGFERVRLNRAVAERGEVEFDDFPQRFHRAGRRRKSDLPPLPPKSQGAGRSRTTRPSTCGRPRGGADAGVT